MNWGLTEIKAVQAGVTTGRNVYATAPASNNVKNLWDGYAETKGSDTAKMSTIDAMATLNAVNKTENTKDVQKKSKAMERMAKLSEAMQNKDFLKLTQKHSDALELLKANPALSGHVKTLEEKLQGITAQSVYFIQKLELSSGQDLSADEINKICSEITNSAKKLEKDAQTIKMGILKAGAYSEAMMKIDDPEKKAKYEKLANETVSNLPDAFKNKAEAFEVREQLLNESEDDAEIETGDFKSPFLYDDDGTLLIEKFEAELGIKVPGPEEEEIETGDFKSPFLYDEDGTLLIEKFEAELGIKVPGPDENINASDDSGNKLDENSNKELEKIRKEYEKDLKEQKETTGKDATPIKDEKGRKLRSVLEE